MGYTSTAAGAYGITAETYDEYKKKLGLSDFKPATQDKIATALIRHADAYNLVMQGNIEVAIQRLTKRWSSLPDGKQSRIGMLEAIAKFTVYQKM